MSGIEGLAMPQERLGFSLTERWQALRDRLLANSAFQRAGRCVFH
jgi:hypothetical protein